MNPLLVVATLTPVQFSESDVRVITEVEQCCGHGWSIAVLPDLDGDGRADFAAGIPDDGRVIAYGSRTGEIVFEARVAGSDLGASLASAGDVDGDGVTDLAAGSPGEGRVRIFSGVDGSLLLELRGDGTGDAFGYAVAGPGAAGNSRLLVGAPGWMEGGVGGGRAYVFAADGRALRTWDGAPGDELGTAVGRLADLDGDGVDEYVLGARGGRYVAVYNGATGERLYRIEDSEGRNFGEYFVADVGDVNGDGKSDLYVGDFGFGAGRGRGQVFSGISGARLWVIEGEAIDGVGPGRGAGDVDGDGYADLIVGHHVYSGEVPQGGRVRIYSGVDGRVLDTYTSATIGAQLGFDAAGLGDVDDDGRFDFLVSAAPIGRVYVLAGRIERAANGPQISAQLTGAWYEPATPGQGLMIEILERRQEIFLAWFTFAAAGDKLGTAGQRWLTGQGAYAGDRAEIVLTTTAGGAFDAATTTTNTPAGTAQLHFESCARASFDYQLTDDRSGTLELIRIVDPASCP